MHRSGTSALTGLLDRLGFYAGPDASLTAADDYNTRGYFELRELHAFNEELLAALGGSWDDVLNVDTSRLGGEVRGRFELRARDLVAQLDAYGPWVIKDPRLCVLLPFWLEFLGTPLCILIHRSPLAVGRSLARRDGFPIHVGIALWEFYNRAALSATERIPRVLVGHRELVGDTAAAVARLVHAIEGTGVRGLDRLREITASDAQELIDPSLDHHAVMTGDEHGYVTAVQRELAEALESGAALEQPVAPLSAGAREALREHVSRLREAEANRADLRTLAKLIESKDRDIRALQEFVARRDEESSLYIASLRAHLAAKEEELQTLHDRLRSAETPASDESVPPAPKLP